MMLVPQNMQVVEKEIYTRKVHKWLKIPKMVTCQGSRKTKLRFNHSTCYISPLCQISYMTYSLCQVTHCVLMIWRQSCWTISMPSKPKLPFLPPSDNSWAWVIVEEMLFECWNKSWTVGFLQEIFALLLLRWIFAFYHIYTCTGIIVDFFKEEDDFDAWAFNENKKA